MKENNKEVYSRIREKSTKKQIVFMSIWILIFLFLAFEVAVLAGYTLGKIDREKLIVYNAVDSLVKKAFPKEPNIVTEEKKLTFAALGNIYVTPNMIKGALDGSEYNFTDGLENIQEKLKEYDFVLANLYTTIAGKKEGYSTLKSYNAPDELVTTLKDLNISAVATSTYHAYDKKDAGIKATIEKLEEAGIKQTGISTEDRALPIILSKDDINIGILSYCTKLNVKMTGNLQAVNLLSKENIEEDIKYLKEKNADIIVAYLDSASNDSILTSSEHKKNVDMLVDSGVNIVFGGGVAAVQERYEDEIDLADGQKSHIYTIYSLGDFMGGYTTDNAKASIIPSFEIKKNIIKTKEGEIKHTTFEYKVNAPIVTWTAIDKKYAKEMYIIEDEIDNFNNDKSDLVAKEYNAMEEEYERIMNMYK